ncbi:unnamed protein product [Euphydryas editha]|uniref:Aminoacyl tRNA synthase complex-interacting multifunctional protein 2 n=1 Tax=Euphydryas editha TaxID=104508 RepID=A0AAU9TFY5_EUPED|nr:unnamed protein product [Euphydryas editha]
MYHMKNIIYFENEVVLPKCMYTLKNPIEASENITDIKINEQVTKFLKKMPNNQLLDLEERQDKLLHKLDILYERIKAISSLCSIKYQQESTNKTVNNIKSEEVVLILNSENLPWFLNIFLKGDQPLNVAWHVHSSVPNAKISKIEAFFRKFQDLYKFQTDSKVNLRLIFKDSTAAELKLSTLGVSVMGTVNILRYLCLTYPNIVPYDYNNYEVEGLLDICYQIESASDKNKQILIPKLFTNSKKWIVDSKFSIVDLAAFNIAKQLQNSAKYVPQQWLNDCQKVVP